MSSFVTPTRLAVGLEAKKSSSDYSDTPRVLLKAKLLVPPCRGNSQRLRQSYLCQSTKLVFEKARFFGICGMQDIMKEFAWMDRSLSKSCRFCFMNLYNYQSSLSNVRKASVWRLRRCSPRRVPVLCNNHHKR